MEKLGQPWNDCNPIAIAILKRTGQRHTLVLVSEMIDYVVGLRHGEICKNVVAASCISIKYGITNIFKFVVQVLFLKGESLVVFFYEKST